MFSLSRLLISGMILGALYAPALHAASPKVQIIKNNVAIVTVSGTTMLTQSGNTSNPQDIYSCTFIECSTYVILSQKNDYALIKEISHTTEMSNTKYNLYKIDLSKPQSSIIHVDLRKFITGQISGIDGDTYKTEDSQQDFDIKIQGKNIILSYEDRWNSTNNITGFKKTKKTITIIDPTTKKKEIITFPVFMKKINISDVLSAK